MPVTASERAYLRDLAKRQAEYAALPEMAALRRLWTLHNGLKGERPMVTFEMWTCGAELLPPLRCQSPEAQRMERHLQSNLTNYERIRDDRVVPPAYVIPLTTAFSPFDLPFPRTTVADSTGAKLGYHVEPPIQELGEELDRLGQTTMTLDTAGAEAERARVEEVLGDILPVEIRGMATYLAPSNVMLNLLGMENMMYAIYDYPEAFHTAMDRITDMLIQACRVVEDSGYLSYNNDFIGVPQGTYGFNDELPGRDTAAGPARLRDVWGYLDSQETVSISPAAFEEFFFPSYARQAALYGLVNYGCCEPVHEIWDTCISKLPNLRKVSISPWCDVRAMGERLRGGRVIFHRKPDPTFVGVGAALDEEGFRAYVDETLEAARGCKVEFSFRDVYTLGGHPDKPSRAVAIVKQEIDRLWQP